MRLGIFGGSFDPVHNGHLALAEACRKGAKLDRVLLVPAAQQPHKPSGPVASAADRLRMIELAIAERHGLAASGVEISRGGVSYTVDTLRTIAVEFPGAKLFLLMGADTLHDLPTWREPAEVCRLATPLAVHRAGEPPVDFAKLIGIAAPAVIRESQQHVIDMPLMDVSSSEIRKRVARGLSIAELVPSAVGGYIAAGQLYS